MRFDYQPPIAMHTTSRYRRLLTLYLTILGVGCISYALITHNTNSYDENNDLPAPKILSHKTAPTLSLAANASGTKSNPLISAAARANAKNTPESWQSVTIKSGDTLSKIFGALGIPHNLLEQILQDRNIKKVITKLHPGQIIDFKFDEQEIFKELKLKLSNTKTLYVTSTDEGLKHYYEEQTPITRIRFSSGKIEDSLFTAGQNAGLDDSMIMQMAEVLGWDIDFSSDIRANDSFKILYEEEFLEGKRVKTGKILALEFINCGTSYRAVRYTDSKGHEGFYTPNGQSLQKAFIRNPVNFTRISSHFSTNRRHPVLHKIRAHKGVDYAAPQGTPVKAAGDGRIKFLGTKGGYGKAIEINHGQKYSTFYAHLSRFNSKLKHGAYVKQGQIIGYVGQTGLATGPHLHYEFRIKGVHHNPITVKLPRTAPIAGKEKNEFVLHAGNTFDMLDSHSQLAKHD